VLVHKIAGAMAARGADLATVVSAARQAAERVCTVGVALSPCVQPGKGPAFELPNGFVELGLGVCNDFLFATCPVFFTFIYLLLFLKGIHGEPGRRRVPVKPVDSLAAEMLQLMLAGCERNERGYVFPWLRFCFFLADPGETAYASVLRGGRVVLLVNNLGGLSCLELAVATRSFARCLVRVYMFPQVAKRVWLMYCCRC
jgi:dihydroxyacetone kinase